MDQLMTPKELSEKLQIKLSTVYKWVHYKYVPYVKMGDLIRFKEIKIEEWVDKRSWRGRFSYKTDMPTSSLNSIHITAK
jgi:excisionase family DNA binding protein